MKKITIELINDNWVATIDNEKLPIWKSKTLLKLLKSFVKYAKGQNL